MSVRSALGTLLRAAVRFRVVNSVLAHPRVRARLQHLSGFDRLYAQGWLFPHPFDRHYRTHTSGFVPAQQLASSPLERERAGFYAGSQPSIIRAALQTLPAPQSSSFIDLGCGKGRPLIVASELQFRAIIGVELSGSLARAARRNAAIVRRRFPHRVAIQVELCDASAYVYPPGNLVIFLYNPFGEPVMARVIERLQGLMAEPGRMIFLVYYNPVHGHLFDAAGGFSRYFAATLPYGADERGFGPDGADTVVIWQAGGNSPAHPDADAPIRVVVAGIRAELA